MCQVFHIKLQVVECSGISNKKCSAAKSWPSTFFSTGSSYCFNNTQAGSSVSVTYQGAPSLVLGHRAHAPGFLRARRQQPGAGARARRQAGVRAVKSSISPAAHHIQRVSFTYIWQVQPANHFWLKSCETPTE